MDERTLEAAQAYEQREVQAALSSGGKVRDYTVVVLGHKREKPFVITARRGQDCVDQLVAKGFDPKRSQYGYGYPFGDDVMIYGNNDEAKKLVEASLRR